MDYLFSGLEIWLYLTLLCATLRVQCGSSDGPRCYLDSIHLDSQGLDQRLTRSSCLTAPPVSTTSNNVKSSSLTYYFDGDHHPLVRERGSGVALEDLLVM